MGRTRLSSLPGQPVSNLRLIRGPSRPCFARPIGRMAG